MALKISCSTREREEGGGGGVRGSRTRRSRAISLNIFALQYDSDRLKEYSQVQKKTFKFL